jgi:hypothetical protein
MNQQDGRPVAHFDDIDGQATGCDTPLGGTCWFGKPAAHMRHHACIVGMDVSPFGPMFSGLIS